MKSLARWWLSGFGAGYVPVAPASWGSLVGVLLVWFMSTISEGYRVVIWGGYFGVSLLCYWILSPMEEMDPSWIVADEILALLSIALIHPLGDWVGLASGYVFFRFWDIVKVYPMDISEKLPPPWGIFADDMVAAIYTLACLMLLGS